MNDLISRQDAVDEIEYELEMINSALDSITLDFNARERLRQRKGEAREILNSIQLLPSAQQWIPCSERLPEEYKVVLITILFRKAKTFNQIPYLRMAYYCNGFWHHIPQDNTMFPRKIEDFECGEPCVTAWMPLPQPWKEMEDE